jgi:MYXO-CTERM domain-containing protein
MQHRSLRLVAQASLLASVALLVPHLAEAHIKLMYPVGRWLESGQGDPQKSKPCGGEALGGKAATPTKMRTKLKPGSTISVTFSETIHHPGHFRIAFDDDGDDAFTEPTSATDIVDPPMMPVLKDNLFPNHQQGQLMKVDVTLPNITCANCTLQVIQVMTEGGGATMYHHCADLELTNDMGGGGSGADAGTSAPSSDAASSPGGLDASVAPGTGGSYGGTGGSSGGGGTGGDHTGGSSGSGGNSGSTGGAPADSSGGTTGSSPSSGGSGGTPVTSPPTSGPDAAATTGNAPNSRFRGSVGACAMGYGSSSAPLALVIAAVGAAFLRRRRR